MAEFREANIVPNTPTAILDRIEIEGDTAVIADVTNVATRVFQYDTLEDAKSDTDGTEVGTTITTAAADCMYNTLQTDGLWGRKDLVGYNLRIDIPKARFPYGGKYYRVENVVQPSASGAESSNLEPWILYALPSAID